MINIFESNKLTIVYVNMAIISVKYMIELDLYHKSNGFMPFPFLSQTEVNSIVVTFGCHNFGGQVKW